MTRQNKGRRFNLLRSSSVAVARKTRMGFSLVESAIVLAVVGLVVAGIWVGAASLKQRRFEQQFMEGFLVLATNAQKYLRQGDSCLVGSLSYERPDSYHLFQPKQWTEIGLSPSLRVDCESTSTFFPNEKYLNVRFWDIREAGYLPVFCQNLLKKLGAVCSRSGDCYLDSDLYDYECQQTGYDPDIDIQFRIGRN